MVSCLASAARPPGSVVDESPPRALTFGPVVELIRSSRRRDTSARPIEADQRTSSLIDDVCPGALGVGRLCRPSGDGNGLRSRGDAEVEQMDLA